MTTDLEAVPPADPGAAAPFGADVAIRTEHLTKRYGNLFAVHDVNLEIPRGAVFGLIGPNGAGKSTTFAIMASLLSPTSGRVQIAGFDPEHHPKEVRRVIGYMPDVMGVYDNLRVDEYLEFFAAAYRVPATAWRGLVDGLLELVDLGVKRDTMVNDLSRGMKQRLSLARALVHDPEVLILDEPASGLDPRARIELRGLVLELRNMGKTVVISSHILAELEEMCTDIAILEAGRLLVSGPPSEIRRQLRGGRVVRVRLMGGEEREFTVADEEGQRALLHQLIAVEGLPVLECHEEETGLEDLFMRITKGIVQ